MFKKVLKFVLYGVAIFFIVSVGSAILIPILLSDSEEDFDTLSQQSSAASITGSTFYHPPSGWRFEIPDGWQVQDDELARKLYQESKELVESSTGETVQQAAKPSGELALVHSSGSTLNYKYQEYDKNRFPDTEEMVQILYQMSSDAYKQMAGQGGHEVKSERSKVKIGKTDFDNFHFTILDSQTKSVLLTNQTYVAEINSLLAMITYSCMAEDICSAMDTAVGSSSFE